MKTLVKLTLAILLFGGVSMLLFAWFGDKDAAEFPVAGFPDPVVDEPLASASGTKTAVLAGGCFWCTEGVFENVAGVTDVVSGYAGGTAQTAHYDIVSSGSTGHAEAVQITYDPSRITYGTILKYFFAVAHDPTQRNRQGPDWGTQYRSAIFPADEQQKRIAEAYITQLDHAGVFSKPIATTIEPFDKFYPAEAYHQDYVDKHPHNPYIMMNALPKIEKLRKMTEQEKK